MAFWKHEGIDSGRYFDVPLPGTDAFRRPNVDFGLLEIASTPLTLQDHRVAAAHSLFADYMDANANRPYDWAEVEFDLTEAKPIRITIDEFLGPFYDGTSGQLTSTDAVGIYGRKGHDVFPDLDGLRDAAYAAVFSSPPYGVRTDDFHSSEDGRDAHWHVITGWFHEVNEVLFGGLSSDLEIYAWSTDWSDYFDAGNEEAGAHCWTVRRPNTKRIAGISNSWCDS